MDRRIAAIALVTVLLGACTRGGPDGGPADAAPPLRELRVVTVEPGEGREPQACPVLAGVALAIAGGGLDLGDRPALQIVVGCEGGEEPGSIAVHVAATVSLIPAGAPEETWEGDAIETCRACGTGGTGLPLLATTARAIRQALDLAAAQRRVAAASDEGVVALLADPGALSRQVVLTAVGEAGDRHLRAAVPALSALLPLDDPDVALRAVGALGQIGDPAAIPALGRIANGKAPERAYAALRAIADIGGRDARRAIELVGGQTTDPGVAREARDLLQELDDGRRE